MDEIKFSQQLSNKLGEDRMNEIAELGSLVDFKAILVDMMDVNNLSDNVRESVLQKMERLTEVLVKISSISAMHISNDAKREKIEKELDGLDLKTFKKDLYLEIGNTKKTLQDKMKNIAKKIKETVSEKASAVEKMFDDNMRLVTEAAREAKKKESELKRQDAQIDEDFFDDAEDSIDILEEKPTLESLESKKSEVLASRDEVKEKKRELESEYEKTVDERQLVVANNKALGFIPTFRRLWSHRKDDPDKKQGFFTVLKNAYHEAAFSREESSKNGSQEKIDDLYNKQLEIAMQKRKCEQDYKKLSRQLKELNKVIGDAYQSCLEESRATLDQATAPISKEEITPERLNNLVDKVGNVGKGLGDRVKTWKDNVKRGIDIILAYTVDPIVDTLFGKNDEDKKGDANAPKNPSSRRESSGPEK